MKNVQRANDNPVAKFMGKFNRPVVHRDRKKDAKRGAKPKHNGGVYEQ